MPPKAVMRTPFVQIFLAIGLSGAALVTSCNAQEMLDRKVSLNLTDVSLIKVLNALEVAAKVNFVYSSDYLRLNEKVTVRAEMKTLGEILHEVLTPLRIVYRVQENNDYIVLIAEKEAEEQSAHLSDSIEALRQPDVPVTTVSGKVNDHEGNDLPGVNVLVKGTAIGTTTDMHGNFFVDVPDGNAVLVFSFIGFATREIAVNHRSTIMVRLAEELTSLNEVVITALGIKRSEKSVTYSTEQVSGDELNRTKTDNLMNTLAGKIPGVTIFPSASGLGGSSKVILRGNRSFSQSNQPLYVVDGIPITNSSNSNGQPNSPFGGPVDGGDGISNLNPDDIEGISILKGASASALYGSQAANGVILITTKKGAQGVTHINFSTSFMTSSTAYRPALQNSYGRTSASAKDSWGSKIPGNATDNVDKFFRQGFNWTTAINLSGGSEIAQTYFSFANIRAKGIMLENDLDRNNLRLQQTGKFLRKKLTLDASVNYISQKIDNTPSLGLYFNPLTGLYLFPRGMDISPYKAQYEFADSTGYSRQHWVTNEDIQQNPWWVVYRNPNYTNRKRLLLAGNAHYAINQWLGIQVRGNTDRVEDTFEQRLYSGTQSTLSKPNGQFVLNTQVLEQKYGDALLIVKVPVKSVVEADGVIGASITDSRTHGTALGPGLGLSIPNLFVAQNMVSGTVNYASTYPENHSQLQSVFGNLNVSFRDWVFLNLSGRNDWSSNLSFTSDVSYFYPSAGISFLLTEAFKLSKNISYVKVRVNYAQVGNTVPQYVTNPVNYLDDTGSVVLSTVAPFGTLKPERTKAWEAGADTRFFNNRLSVTFNYYRSNTFNQFIKVVPSVATGYSVGYVNAGNVQNAGFEYMVSCTVIDDLFWEWSTTLNGSQNVNKVIDVDSKNGIDKFVLTTNDNTSYQSVLAKGGSYGDIYGVTARRDDQGRIIVNPDGTPQLNNGFHFIGNPNPKFAMGWSNTLRYKNFGLNFLFDGKFGGSVFSMTQAILDQYGVSEETGDARDRGGVTINGVNESGEAVTHVDAQKWYTSIGGRQGISELYVYDATVVRLREASLGYTVPIRQSIIKNLKISLIGRNLFYVYKKAPYDPELVMSTGNGLSGVDIFNQPATRNIGFTLNVGL